MAQALAGFDILTAVHINIIPLKSGAAYQHGFADVLKHAWFHRDPLMLISKTVQILALNPALNFLSVLMQYQWLFRTFVQFVAKAREAWPTKQSAQAMW
ncbi:hypothetical protein KCP73_07365 [Salmonella enterica subsp. enterica]|nr:hypothetical protein KCP73_07365 [Salmonella enterica subsp. enterica]